MDKNVEQIWETPLPQGYEKHTCFLRRWLLDLRLRVAAIPVDRKKMLERKVYEYHSNGKSGKNGAVVNSRAGNVGRLVGARR